MKLLRLLITVIVVFLFYNLGAQSTVKGVIRDVATGESLVGATVVEKGTTTGTVSDIDGAFQFRSKNNYPVTVVVSFIGYVSQEINVGSNNPLEISLERNAVDIGTVNIVGQRISDKQKSRPLTVESMDVIAIKETPSDNFYDGLGNMKGVDLTAASLGFKIINTRGFNSTSPVRSLQLIDGVDNQAPGLNFSLGNFLGSPELDVQKVDIISGASSAFYGPNAFNGVINIENKNPFFSNGISASIKVGERALTEVAARYAESTLNKEGFPSFAYKLNISYLTANDWEADNFNPVDGTVTDETNPGGYDAVNIYGDEFFPFNDFTEAEVWDNGIGLGRFHRTGYKEQDLVNYDTENLKANLGLHFRLKPDMEHQSPELIFASNFGTGTTVYQGDNRFRLEDILFFQQRIEIMKRDQYFVRAYVTMEDAGNSYDPYATALLLQDEAKSNRDWGTDYFNYWVNQINGPNGQMVNNGYPDLSDDFTIGPPPTFIITYNQDSIAAAEEWLANNQDLLFQFHDQAENSANTANPLNNSTDYLDPGSSEFQEAFNRISSSKNNDEENGTLFFDKSKLYHIQGEYEFHPEWTERWIIGGNGRLYTPRSEGTIFYDTADVKITNSEFGIYTGIEKKLASETVTMNATIRTDKNENFDFVFTPAVSFVWKPAPNNFFRLSFSSALRNPTLSDQYLFLDVGPATLAGNLNGVDSLITIESFSDFRNSLDLDTLNYFNIDPIRPEKVKTFELGYRTTLWNNLYVDAGYYYSIYDDFLGFNIGIDAEFGGVTNFPTSLEIFRYSANSENQVTTQGFAIGLNYYFSKYYMLAGNYSWNKLNVEFDDDPIIPAFNTPEHKYNLSLSGRDLPLKIGKIQLNNMGFNINYKWIDGFLFEGSPQFTGLIPDYDLLDAQINMKVPKMNTTFKLGATNLLNNKQFQTYGGPRIGRLTYFSLTYELRKK